MTGGRPSDYTPETGAEICRLLSNGVTLIAMTGAKSGTKPDTKPYPGIPDYSTVMRWLDKYPEFRDSYARARDQQADFYADEVADLGRQVLINPKDSNAYRVAGDLLKWQAMIRAPRRYSERMHQTLEHSGGVAVSFTVSGLDDMAGSRQDVVLKP